MSALSDEPRLIGAREAAAMLGVSVDTVRRAVRDGRLPVVRLRERGWLRFRTSDIERLVGSSREAAFMAEVEELIAEGVLVKRER
jgi:excisionase family DNA binding protein